MKGKLRGPVLLFGPVQEFQPWIANDVEMIRNWLQDKYGMIGIIYKPTAIPTPGAGYWYLNVGVS